jgi:DeoR family transcriptional regulator of aga operon
MQPDRLAVEKRRIARAAAELVAEGDTVGLGGGTTTLEVTRALHGRRVTIVTNALDLVLDLVPVPGARVVMLAGELMASARELIGPLVEETLAHVNMDTLFLSVNGLSAESGVGIMSHLEAGVYAAMAARARRLVVVADHSKIGRPALAHALPITGVHVLVTDAAGPSAALTAIKDAGVRVIEV